MRLKTRLKSTMKYKFDMIFHIKAAQNMVAEHYMNTISMIYMIFHLKATIWKVFWHNFPPQGNYMKTILT